MTEGQIDALRRLIEQEIRAAQVDDMEHGVWGWYRQLEEGWQEFKDSFNEANALVALKDLYANNDAGMKDLADSQFYTLLAMNADDKRFIKQFALDRLWSDHDKLHFDLDAYATVRGIDPFEAMKEYEYQVERISKFLSCY